MVTVFWQNQPFWRKIFAREAIHQWEVTALLLTQAGEEKEPSGLCNRQVQRLRLAWSTGRCRHWEMPRAPALLGCSEQAGPSPAVSMPPSSPQLPGPWPSSPEGARTSLSECQHSNSREPWDRSLLDLSRAGVHAWSSLGYVPLFMAMGTLWNMRRSFSKGTVGVVGRKKQMPSTSSSKSWQRPLDMLTKPIKFAHHTG